MPIPQTSLDPADTEVNPIDTRSKPKERIFNGLFKRINFGFKAAYVDADYLTLKPTNTPNSVNRPNEADDETH